MADLMCETFLQYESVAPSYVYEWKLQQSVMSSELTTLACSLVTPFDTDVRDFHCTAHISDGPDIDYKQRWDMTSAGQLAAVYMYWTEHQCALPE